jgi:hypothetical protein
MSDEITVPSLSVKVVIGPASTVLGFAHHVGGMLKNPC